MINHLNLSYFIAVVREMNFTRAAEKLYISQQALSNHISSLEKEMGVRLFERRHTLKLTYAGEVFYKYALELEDCYHRLYQEMGDIKQEARGEIRIGTSHTRGRFILPKLLPEFIEKYPGIRVKVLEGNTDELNTALLHGEIDIVLGQPKAGITEISYEQLFMEEVMLVIAKPLLDRYHLEIPAVKYALEEEGKLSSLKDIPFLLNKKGNATRIVADEIFKREDIVPHILIETENIETLGEMCKHAIGAAFYPIGLLENSIKTYETTNHLLLFRLNANCTKIPFALGYRKNIYMSRAIQQMIQMIKTLFKEPQQKGCGSYQ